MASAHRTLSDICSILPLGPLAKKEVVQPAAQPLPETVLDERNREAETRRQKLVDAATSAPFTKDLLAALGGTIEGVKIPGSDHP